LTQAATAVRDATTSVQVSIVMPCLDEEGAVSQCVYDATSWMERRGIEGEVVVVDNGSRDASAVLAMAAGARVVWEPELGYGNALRHGIESSRGEYVIFGDCDGTYDFSRLDDVLDELEAGADVVVGNRFSGDIEDDAMPWAHRYIGTPVLTRLIQIVSGANLVDSQSGLRGARVEALRELRLRSAGMEFASEMIVKAARARLRVAEVPIAYRARTGEAKLRLVRDGWRHLRYIMLTAPTLAYMAPGASFTALGVLILGLSLAPEAGVRLGWQPIYAGSTLTILGLNAIVLGLAAASYLAHVRGDPESRLRAVLFDFRAVIGGAVLLMAVGAGLDLYLLIADPSNSGVVERVGLAAIAQTLLISGGNYVLSGFLVNLLREPQ
jgi:hypothetical protein